jgi:outer membrane protein
VQYRFGEANGIFRPYLGLGITYAKFDSEHSTAALSALTGGTPLIPTRLSIESKLAATMQLGGTYKIDDRWFVDGAAQNTQHLVNRSNLGHYPQPRWHQSGCGHALLS